MIIVDAVDVCNVGGTFFPGMFLPVQTGRANGRNGRRYCYGVYLPVS